MRTCVWRIADSGEISNSPHTGRRGGSATLMFANRISSSTSCSIWPPETSPPSSSRDVLRHRFQSCNTSARTVPRLSSLRPLPILAGDLLLPDFCSGPAALSGRSIRDYLSGALTQCHAQADREQRGFPGTNPDDKLSGRHMRLGPARADEPTGPIVVAVRCL